MEIIFFVSCLVALFCVYKCKKHENPLNGFSWVFISFVILLCIQAMFAGIFTLIHIEVGVFSAAIVNVVLITSYFILRYYKIIETQMYYYDYCDLIVLIAILFCVFWRFVEQFGVRLNIQYITSDPSIHLRHAMDVLNTGKVSGMYFASFINAIFIEMLNPVLDGFIRYKAFVLMDGLMLFLSGALFWSVLAQNKRNKKREIIPEIILVLVYLMAYPLNNMVFGFVYLGMSVTLLATLIIVCNLYGDEKSNESLCMVFMMLLCMAIGLCYSLFAPAVFVAVCIYISIQSHNKKEKITTWIWKNIAVFLIPCILILVYSYLGMFASEGLEVSSSIQNEGYIYKDIFMNAWIILIPFLLGVISIFREKRIEIETIVLGCITLFTVILFILGLCGKVSSYYYYKTNYIMSFLLFVFAYKGIKMLMKESEKTVWVYLMSIVVLFSAFFLQVESKVYGKNNQFVSYHKIPIYLDIYQFNKDAVENGQRYSAAKLDLYREVFDNYDTDVICLAEWVDCYWYEALTDQRMDSSLYYYWLLENSETYWENIVNNKNIKHMLVLVDSQLYSENSEKFNNAKKVYENEAGFIVELDTIGKESLLNAEKY